MSGRCTKEVCECIGTRLTLRMFCQHFNAERPENEVERESIRMWSSLSDYTRERCLKHLRRKIPSDVIFNWYAQRRNGFAIGSDAIRFHFDQGMAIRNLLRDVVSDDDLPLDRSIRGGELCVDQTTWDDYYYGALYDLVGGETSDPPNMTPTRQKESPYFAKCKRIRSDGPTPCYCCPGECVGEPRGPEENAAFCVGDFSSRQPAFWKFCVWVMTCGIVRIP